MKLTVAELFAGVGGFRVGLNNIENIDKNGKAIENGNWEFVWTNQYEPSTKEQHAFNCYTKRFGSENISNEDIHNVKKESIPDHSLLVGGFPCQDYSVARSLSNEKGIKGKKGVLFWDIKDILIKKNSPFVLLENVDRLLKSPSTMRGRDFAIMLKTFDELDYNVQWRVINAGEYSMPQKRKRVFIFAYKKGLIYDKNLNQKHISINEDIIFNKEFKIEEVEKIFTVDLNKYKDTLDIMKNYNEGKFLDTGYMNNGKVEQSNLIEITEEKFTLKSVLKLANKNNSNIENYIVDDEKLEKWKHLKGSKRIERESKTGHKYLYSEGQMSFPENLDEPARTMLTSEGTLNRSSHIIYDKKIKKHRILTPIECELIQMFPMNWTNTMPNRKRYFMMGNALVTGILSRLENTLRTIIESEV